MANGGMLLLLLMMITLAIMTLMMINMCNDVRSDFPIAQVNFAPSLAVDSEVDFEVKSQVLTDVLNLVNVRSQSASFSSKSTKPQQDAAAAASATAVASRSAMGVDSADTTTNSRDASSGHTTIGHSERSRSQSLSRRCPIRKVVHLDLEEHISESGPNDCDTPHSEVSVSRAAMKSSLSSSIAGHASRYGSLAFTEMPNTDAQIIACLEREMKYAGGFRRIFPSATSSTKYKALFDDFKPLNAVLGRYLARKVNC